MKSLKQIILEKVSQSTKQFTKSEIESLIKPVVVALSELKDEKSTKQFMNKFSPNHSDIIEEMCIYDEKMGLEKSIDHSVGNLMFRLKHSPDVVDFLESLKMGKYSF